MDKSNLLLLTLGLVLSLYLKATWTSLVESEFYGKFFVGRSEYLMMKTLPGWVKRALKKTPLLDWEVRLNLDEDPAVAKAEWYDSAKHDRPYRALRTSLLSKEECSDIKAIIQRNSLQKAKSFEGHGSLFHEFDNLPLLHVLGLQEGANVDVTEKESKLISTVLHRVQKTVEETFNTTSIFLEFADLTKRTTPREFSSGWAYLYYLSTGGHGAHADQCSIPTSQTSWQSHFECHLLENNCCAHRTNSVLLYLNTEEDKLVGGNFYMVDRDDLENEHEYSFEGPALSKLFQKTIKVEPTCGSLMMFTSDAKNIHGVFPIWSGTRYAMPMWFSDISHLPWHEEEALLKYLDPFWNMQQYAMCPSMGKDTGVAVPPMFEKYVGDCQGMVSAMKEFAYSSRTEYVPNPKKMPNKCRPSR